jgi:alkylation response protein AidB-like acyl-CoA dehydrogenase
MDVRHTPEQGALRDSVARVVHRFGPRTVGQLDDVERALKLDATIDAAGWRELRTATSDGAPWASGVEVAIVAEQLSRGLADAPFVGPTLASELRRAAGVPADGARETVAMRPDLSRPAAANEHAVAIDATYAESALVLSHDTVISVPVPDAAESVDLTRSTVPLGPAEGVALGTISPGVLSRWTALALTVTAADLVGGMQGAIDLTGAYVSERQQFGRPVGSFQAVQHLMADAVVQLEGSRATLLYAAWAVDALAPIDALAAAASAKAYASRAARGVHETAIQLHGGIGNTWECLAHVHLRRSLLSTDVCGGVGPNLARVLEHAGPGARA